MKSFLHSLLFLLLCVSSPAATGDVIIDVLGASGRRVAVTVPKTNDYFIGFDGSGNLIAKEGAAPSIAIGSITGLGTNVATWLGTPSSANLRATLTDEVGTGAAYFVGGALGTPASATLTNATGLPWAGVLKNGSSLADLATRSAADLTSGVLPAARLPLPTTSTVGGVMRNTGAAGQYVVGIAGNGLLLYDTPPSAVWGNITGTLSDQTDLQTALDDKLSITGDGSGLTGITASQVGALEPTGDGSGLTGITASQVGAIADGDTLSNGLTFSNSPQQGLKIKDSTGDFWIGFGNSDSQSANRWINWTVNNASRSINLWGNLTVSSAATVSGTNTGDISPAGSGSELQFRSSGTAFGAATNSSVSGGAITLGAAEALGTTSTARLTVANTTSAAAGAQQVSPSIVLEGRGWKTDATAASQIVRFRENVLPVQGTANPSATWRLQSEINNSGTWVDRVTIDSSGVLTLGTFPASIVMGNATIFGATNGPRFQVSSADIFGLRGGSGLNIAQARALGWSSSGSDSTEPADLTLFRDAANTLAQRNGTNAQTFRIYNTFTSSTEHERGTFGWVSNTLRIGTEKGTTSGSLRNLSFTVDGTEVAAIYGNNTAGTPNGLWVNAGYRIGTVGRGSIFFPTAGGAVIWNSAETDFTLLRFGGTSSSFPALKRSSTSIQARLADDSGYTTMDAQHRLQGTAPATATSTGTAGDVRYDADYIYICVATNTWKRALLSTW